MANALTPIILVFLISVSAAGTRTKLYPVHGQHRTSESESYEDDGICSSMVEKQGYVCEERKVLFLNLYCLFSYANNSDFSAKS